MTVQRKRRWIYLILVSVLLITTPGCTNPVEFIDCILDGGHWAWAGDYCIGGGPEDDQKPAEMNSMNSDADADAVAAEVQPDPEAEAGNAAAPPQDEQPLPAEVTIASCLPQPDDYTIEITDHTEHEGEVKHKCNAKMMLTNNSNRKLLCASYRVHNYGGHNYEKWVNGGGYQSLEPGETTEMAEFYRCTGGNCGEGEWYYFREVSILYGTPECLQLIFSQEEKIPESIISIWNPCAW